MSTVNEQPGTADIILPSSPSSPTSVWQRRFFIILTVLGWLTLVVGIFWVVGQIITPIVLIGFAALLAYLIFPMVRFFDRVMPRFLAILASVLLLLVVMGLVIFFIVAAAVQQLGLLINSIRDVIQHPEKYPNVQALLDKLDKLGITKGQVHVSGQQVVDSLNGAIKGILPVVSSIFFVMIALLLVATLAVYFMVDGERINNWFRHRTPLRYRGIINRFLDELQHSMGGFVRGQILLATIMAVIVGVGAFIIGVPYVFLLAMIVFICEFIPQIGAYISGAIGIAFALSHGWQVGVIYAIFVTVMQAGLDGQILSPRILGHSVGLHPIISVFALLVGTALFGLLGAFFACPAAGIIQNFVRAFWDTWRQQHPDQFPIGETVQTPVKVIGQGGHDQAVVIPNPAE